MKNKFIKTLIIVLTIIFFRSLYFNQEFYGRLWEENQITILFLGFLFAILIFVVIRFQKFTEIDND